MNSSITKRVSQGEVLTITPGAKKIFQAIYRSQAKSKIETDETIARLRVSEVISKMSFYYEKIRNAVQYSEEHLLRKEAIERIIRRQLMIENPIKFSQSDSLDAARHLLIELIRAGYLKNNSLPESQVNEVSIILDKYLTCRHLVTNEVVENFNFFGQTKNQQSPASGLEVTNWLVGLAAAEIEKNIIPNEVNDTIVAVMYHLLEKKITLPNNLPYQEDLAVQIYIAIHRRLLKFDDDMLSLILLNYYNGDWSEATPEVIKRVAKNFVTLRQLITEQLNHPLREQLISVVSSYTVFFDILQDVVAEDPVKVYDEFFDDPKAFARRIKNICTKRYSKAKKKLWRSAVRSIIYILLTKSIFAVLLELPAAKFFGSVVNPLALVINISFPAILLFLAIALTRLPGEDNTKKIITGIEEIVFIEKQRNEAITLRKPIGRHRVMNIIFGLLYIATFFVSFGVVVWLLDAIYFSWVSIIIFLFFLAFVSFFIIRIRRGAKEWIVIEGKDTFLRFLFDFFSTPIIATGKWLSTKFSRLNVFVFILDFIIEAPFKIFVEIAEEWTKYVRERKDKI